MSDVSRIFVVEGDEGLNRSLVNSLRKDGYVVQGVMSGADAVRVLWSEEYDVVICDLKTPGADGFELLQWLRAYRPNTRMIMVSSPGSDTLRMQALENGAASYLEKPLDLRVLKEELRRNLQQGGFSANLDSFDLLDVIQIITMSRKNIALLVNTGLEERGVLRFQNGDLVWAEYGALRGEEAFFALAAHKNGTIIHQQWHGQIVSNVTLPLSRLIFQALQYRAKYANVQEETSKQQPLTELDLQELDDTPFGFVADMSQLGAQVAAAGNAVFEVQQELATFEQQPEREWWEQTGSLPRLDKTPFSPKGTGKIGTTRPLGEDAAFTFDGRLQPHSEGTDTSIPAPMPADLPSWLTDIPTSSALPTVSRNTLSEWQQPAQPSPMSAIIREPTQLPSTIKTDDLQPPVVRGPSQALPSLMRPADVAIPAPVVRASEVSFPASAGRVSGPLPVEGGLYEKSFATSPVSAKSRAVKRGYNYASLVAALQTLGYSVTGFVAAAVVNIEGQPIAQVAVEELDISRICQDLSMTLKNVIQVLGQGMWGHYEETAITTSNRSILMRMIGEDKTTFLLLITTREARTEDSLTVLANVEGAIAFALQ
ncbi:MAG: response regulator [Chloroflexi bacterium]|jgi:DNA-binding response OmpR family regulator/predicted regulator of Ras-like GTPase activity (Roadblock/LC7/MglB family)|nr:MAG: response regulator [Chloroflexota bacterium]